jgi:hypothetical protein
MEDEKSLHPSQWETICPQPPKGDKIAVQVVSNDVDFITLLLIPYAVEAMERLRPF